MKNSWNTPLGSGERVVTVKLSLGRGASPRNQKPHTTTPKFENDQETPKKGQTNYLNTNRKDDFQKGALKEGGRKQQPIFTNLGEHGEKNQRNGQAVTLKGLEGEGGQQRLGQSRGVRSAVEQKRKPPRGRTQGHTLEPTYSVRAVGPREPGGCGGVLTKTQPTKRHVGPPAR